MGGTTTTTSSAFVTEFRTQPGISIVVITHMFLGVATTARHSVFPPNDRTLTTTTIIIIMVGILRFAIFSSQPTTVTTSKQ